MCETTMYLEQHPKVMADLLEVVRMCRRIRDDAKAIRDDARTLRLSLSVAPQPGEAARGAALRDA